MTLTAPPPTAAKADVFVSAVAVLRSYARFLPGFVAETVRTLDGRYTNYELVLVDNGARDTTPTVVGELLRTYRCVRYVRLGRRMKAETAVMAGLDAAIGDFVVTLHPEFDPPAEMPALVEGCRGGADVVVGVAPYPTRPGPVYRMCRWGFLQAARRVLGLDPGGATGGFRCLSRAAVNALTRVRRRRRFFGPLAAEIGLTTVRHPYRFAPRGGKPPRANLRRAARAAASMAVGHSAAPLRLVSFLGLAGSLASFAYSLYVVGVYLLKPDVMPGWTTLSLQVSGLFVLVFVMLALIGEHLGRLMDEAVDRPLYHVRDEQASAVMLADPLRKNVTGQSTEGGG